MEHPKPTYLVNEEGGDLKPFKQYERPRGKVHAIYFADGSIFDVYNGWREGRTAIKPRVRVAMGRAVV